MTSPFVSVLRHAFLGGFLAASMASCIIVEDDEPPTPYHHGYYEPCSYDAECPATTSCWLVEIEYWDHWASDGLCTLTCYDDWDCPLDAYCEGALDGPPLCFQACVDDLDCPPGLACVNDVDRESYDAVCLPW
jgi:hypothetical protein